MFSNTHPFGAFPCVFHRSLVASGRMVVVAASLASLYIPSEAWAAKRKQTGAPASPAQRLTTLRASPPSLLISGRGGSREVRYLSVEVSNIGLVEAQGVQVVISGGSALTFPLRGPKKISPGSRGTYISTVRIPIGVSLQPHAIATCSTCRR